MMRALRSATISRIAAFSSKREKKRRLRKRANRPGAGEVQDRDDEPRLQHAPLAQVERRRPRPLELLAWQEFLVAPRKTAPPQHAGIKKRPAAAFTLTRSETQLATQGDESGAARSSATEGQAPRRVSGPQHL